VPVAIGHDAQNLGDPEVVVVSSAIPESNPEFAEAIARGIPVWPRARMLASLAGDHTSVAVAGTHGKTTTSSMIAIMLSRMGLDPTYLIGGEIDGVGTNAVNGSGEHFVVEADESDGSFVWLEPQVAVITNVEADHLDHYGTLEHVEMAFAEFMRRVHAEGTLVVCGDDDRLLSLAEASGRKVVTYGFAENCDVRCTVLGREGVGSLFHVDVRGDGSADSFIAMPGRHMVSNATAALATAWVLGLDLEDASRSLAAFTGVRRRFDLVGEASGVTIVDDYAHHPTEVRATIGACDDLGFGRSIVLFQPHRYSRTEALAEEFAGAFEHADKVVLMDVYSAGEAPIPGVSGKTVLDAVMSLNPRAQLAYLPHRGDVVPYLSRTVHDGDLVLTMGAGDVTAVGPELLAVLEIAEGEEATPCR
jgi:UDP-N-acetylmuramate--alanine ligase